MNLVTAASNITVDSVSGDPLLPSCLKHNPWENYHAKEKVGMHNMARGRGLAFQLKDIYIAYIYIYNRTMFNYTANYTFAHHNLFSLYNSSFFLLVCR